MCACMLVCVCVCACGEVVVGACADTLLHGPQTDFALLPDMRAAGILTDLF